MNYLPAVKVEAYKDPKNNGKTDSHKTDSKSMERVEKEILKQIKLNEKIIRGDRNA